MSLTVAEVKAAGQELDDNYDAFRKKLDAERYAALTTLGATACSVGAALANAKIFGSVSRDILIGCIVGFGALLILGLTFLVRSLRRPTLERTKLRNFVDEFVETATELRARPTTDEVLSFRIEAMRAMDLYRNATAMDDERKTRQWLAQFAGAMAGSTQRRCFSFHSVPVHEHISSHQLQVIATQVRMCMGPQFDPVVGSLHTHQSEVLARTMHVNAVQNMKAMAQKDRKYAPGYLLGSRIHVSASAETNAEPGLVRLLFWTEAELRHKWAQQYIDVWESFGIPVFWLERSEKTCREIAALITKLDKNSRLRRTFEAHHINQKNVHPGTWPRELDFFIAGDQVLLGYEERNGSLDWAAGADEFYSLATDIVKTLCSEIFYAKEISWYRATQGQRLLREGTDGFVLAYDFVQYAEHRIPSPQPQPNVAPIASGTVTPSPAESTPAPVSSG